MPNYKGHLFGGVVIYLLLIALLTKFWISGAIPTQKLILWFFACLLGSLFPDIDITSKGQRVYFILLFPLTIAALILKKWNLLFLLFLGIFFPLLIRHRGITHKPWFVVIIPFIIFSIFAYGQPSQFGQTFIVYAFFTIGAITHLLLDFGPKQFIKKLF
jgi:hypothetical protein